MNSNSKKIAITIVIIVLAVTTIGSSFYAVNLQKEKSENEKVLIADKEAILKQLTNSRDSLNIAIANNLNLTAELTAERDKVNTLIAELEQSKTTYQSLLKYKDQTFKLKSSASKLLQQVTYLKDENSKLSSEINNKTEALSKSEKQKDSISSQKELLAKHVKKAARINIVDVAIKTLRWKSEKMNIESDKAVRVDMLVTSFIIPGNHLADSGEKKFFIQIISPSNNIIGLKHTEYFPNGKNLDYSEIVTANYDKETLKVTKNIPVKLLEKGLFNATIYNEYGELMGSTSFTLR